YLARRANASCATRSSCCEGSLVSVSCATRSLMWRNAQCKDEGQLNLLVLAQRARGSCATHSATLFFLFFFWCWRNAQSCAAQRAGVLIQG
ncbi:hypothetical protein A2U01_0073368, partial [Trifolium medium]|nr:hypothetical protein [Trifolium medium]